ncbi:MAG: hypothetical protein HDS01_05185 [Bacteroides sp.]|nr:hypothetical protein [Bacteroides sp.]
MANKIATKNDALIKCGLGNISDGISINRLCTADYAKQLGCSINSKVYSGKRLVPTEMLTGGFGGTFTFVLDISPRYFVRSNNYLISNSAEPIYMYESLAIFNEEPTIELTVNNGYLKGYNCEIAYNMVAYLHCGNFGAQSICMGSFIVPNTIDTVSLSVM